MWRRSIVVWAALGAMASGAAWAEPAEAGARPREEHHVAVTLSPLQLISPIVELTGEVRLPVRGDKLSAALILGGGQIESGGQTFTALDAGAQFRWYALGSFDRGLDLAVETLFVDVASGGGGLDVNGQGLSVGAVVGYKYTFGFGLALDGQIGA